MALAAKTNLTGGIQTPSISYIACRRFCRMCCSGAVAALAPHARDHPRTVGCRRHTSGVATEAALDRIIGLQLTQCGERGLRRSRWMAKRHSRARRAFIPGHPMFEENPVDPADRRPSLRA